MNEQYQFQDGYIYIESEKEYINISYLNIEGVIFYRFIEALGAIGEGTKGNQVIEITNLFRQFDDEDLIDEFKEFYFGGLRVCVTDSNKCSFHFNRSDKREITKIKKVKQ